ncbi:hypothetical protein GCM10010439_35850 [Actinocorallia aurantiaca]|uniref:Uncharacterized protein n=1 Tax=Actinocorallia aurantiaca TaxID=46204 RepID=A0ABN3UA87_9ACTN
MDDADLVDGRQRGQHADGQEVELLRGAGPLGGDELVQGGPVDVLADDVGLLAVDLGLDDAGGAEGLDLLGGGDLADEPGPGLGVGVHLSVQELDGDVLAARGPAQVDGALPAGSEASDQLVGTE